MELACSLMPKHVGFSVNLALSWTGPLLARADVARKGLEAFKAQFCGILVAALKEFREVSIHGSPSVQVIFCTRTPGRVDMEAASVLYDGVLDVVEKVFGCKLEHWSGLVLKRDEVVKAGRSKEIRVLVMWEA